MLTPFRCTALSLFVAIALTGCNCGDDHLMDTITTPTPTTTPRDAGHDAGIDAGFDAGIDAGPPDAGSIYELLGVWTVDGTDVRGTYHGQVELRLENSLDGGVSDAGADAGAVALGPVRFIRVVRYNGVVVENRDLWTAWEGSGLDLPVSGPSVTVSLATRDFIVKRDALTRSATSPAVTVNGRVVIKGATVETSYAGLDISGTETWTNRVSSGPTPIFMTDRTSLPTNDEPSDGTKTTYQILYSSFYSLPTVVPYLSRPEFRKMVHQAVIDKTDFDFYRANRNALRVVNKVVDPISQLETLQRAQAYGPTLAEKATQYSNDLYTRFIVPSGVSMVPASINADGSVNYSSDAALWTAMWIASESYRNSVMPDPSTRQHIKESVNALMTLIDISDDPKSFARAIRPNKHVVSQGWHDGTGAYANLQWLEGGNNDMLKGLQYGFFMAWRALCYDNRDYKDDAAGFDCDHLYSSIRKLTDLDVGTLSTQSNAQVNNWLVAYSSKVTTATFYSSLAKAELYSIAGFAIDDLVQQLQGGTILYLDGVADWSGLNLNFVDLVLRAELSKQLDLKLDGSTYSSQATRDSITGAHEILRKERSVLYHALAGAYTPDKFTAADNDDLRWRLREYRAGTGYQIDHSLNPSFSISPFPSMPWKADWNTTDRRQALAWLPLFETPATPFQWKSQREFVGGGDLSQAPTVDYLHMYWFARRYELLGSGE